MESSLPGLSKAARQTHYGPPKRAYHFTVPGPSCNTKSGRDKHKSNPGGGPPRGTKLEGSPLPEGGKRKCWGNQKSKAHLRTKHKRTKGKETQARSTTEPEE